MTILCPKVQYGLGEVLTLRDFHTLSYIFFVSAVYLNSDMSPMADMSKIWENIPQLPKFVYFYSNTRREFYLGAWRENLRHIPRSTFSNLLDISYNMHAFLHRVWNSNEYKYSYSHAAKCCSAGCRRNWLNVKLMK